MSTNLCLGTFRRKLATSGDTCEPDEARRAGSMEKMEKKTGRFSESPAGLSEPSVIADYSWLGAR